MCCPEHNLRPKIAGRPILGHRLLQPQIKDCSLILFEIGFCKDLGCHKKLNEKCKSKTPCSPHFDDTQEFNKTYNYWKDDIAVKVAAYLYIGGLKNGSVRADLMFNWQSGKYFTLMDL